MSFEAERSAVEKWFYDRWTPAFNALKTKLDVDGNPEYEGFADADIHPLSRVQFDDIKFRQPKPNVDFPERTTWVRLSIVPSTASQFTLGADPLTRHNGQIVVQIFHPQRAARNVARVFADIVSDIFNLARITFEGGVFQCRESTLVRVGNADGWYQLNVDTVYVRETGAGTSRTTGTELLHFGLVNTDLDDYMQADNSGIEVFRDLSVDVVFPPTTSDRRLWWFEPPSAYAFAAVYNTIIDDSLGIYDWRWVPQNPKMGTGFDEDRIVFVHETLPEIGVGYTARIHHLFEIA